MFWFSMHKKLTLKIQLMYYKDWVLDPNSEVLLLPSLSNEDYHSSHTHISASWLKKATESFYAFMMHPFEPKKDPTPAMILGTAIHTRLLEYERYQKEYFGYRKEDLPYPEATMGKKENKEWVLSKGFGKIDIGTDFYLAEEIVKMALTSPLVQRAIAGNIEHSIFWNDPDTGVPIKTRPDSYWLTKGGSMAVIVDVKTDNDGSPSGFAKTVTNSRHDIQAAMQVDGILKATGATDYEYIYLVLDKSYPYEYGLYRLVKDDVEFGRVAYKSLLSQIAESVRTGKWPGMADTYAINNFDSINDLGVIDLKLPQYHYSK